MKFLVSILLLISCTAINSCKKDKPSYTLPPATQTGANTFGCKINGEVWVPYAKCAAFTDPCREMGTRFNHPNVTYFLPLSFALNGTRKESNSESTLIINTFQFNLPYATTIKQKGNVFDSLFIEYFDGQELFNYYGSQNQYQDPTNNFTITKLDTINKIMSGTFNFTIVNYDAGPIPDTLHVTEGRFDFKLEDYCKCSQ